MEDSILNTTKKAVGVDPDYTAFDLDILMHVNSAFATLNQLGIGPAEGFSISDHEPTWDSYLHGNKRLNLVPGLVYKMVRLVFDPPTTAHHLSALKELIEQDQWRILVARDTELGLTTPFDVVVEEE